MARLHSPKWYLEGLWLPIHGRLVGLHHLVRGHRLEWRADGDWRIAHFGWIYCYECPDCEGRDLCIWGRYWPNLHRLIIWLCSLRGHGERVHPKKLVDLDNDIWEECLDEWWCGWCDGVIVSAPGLTDSPK